MKPVLWLILLSCALMRTLGDDGRRPRVLTSIPPLYCWAANVAGSIALVENLLPADVGPHDYQFRPSDRRKLQAADVIVINGLGLEDWFAKTLRADGGGIAAKVVETAAGIPTNALIYALPDLSLKDRAAHDDGDHGAGTFANPHLWLDPVFAKHGVSNILAALQRADPSHAQDYSANAAAFLARLTALDAEIRAVTAGFSSRAVVTFHDAFPYLCRRYGLELVGVIEEVPGADPSPRYVAELLKVIRARQVKVIFTEPQFNPRLAKRLARDLGIGIAELDVLETGPLTPTSYEDGMRRNLEVLRKHLR